MTIRQTGPKDDISKDAGLNKVSEARNEIEATASTSGAAQQAPAAKAEVTVGNDHGRVSHGSSTGAVEIKPENKREDTGTRDRGSEKPGLPDPDADAGKAGNFEKGAREIGGRDGPDPTRFGDWEKNGRCIDF